MGKRRRWDGDMEEVRERREVGMFPSNQIARYSKLRYLVYFLGAS